MQGTDTAQLTNSIVEVVEHLLHDVRRHETKKPALHGIREARRLLNALEGELRDDQVSPRGDAC